MNAIIIITVATQRNRRDLNLRPTDPETDSLTTQPPRLFYYVLLLTQLRYRIYLFKNCIVLVHLKAAIEPMQLIHYSYTKDELTRQYQWLYHEI